MDDSLFDFFDEQNKQKSSSQNQHVTCTSNMENVVCDYNFEYESVDESIRPYSETSCTGSLPVVGTSTEGQHVEPEEKSVVYDEEQSAIYDGETSDIYDEAKIAVYDDNLSDDIQIIDHKINENPDSAEERTQFDADAYDDDYVDDYDNHSDADYADDYAQQKAISKIPRRKITPFPYSFEENHALAARLPIFEEPAKDNTGYTRKNMAVQFRTPSPEYDNNMADDRVPNVNRKSSVSDKSNYTDDVEYIQTEVSKLSAGRGSSDSILKNNCLADSRNMSYIKYVTRAKTFPQEIDTCKYYRNRNAIDTMSTVLTVAKPNLTHMYLYKHPEEASIKTDKANLKYQSYVPLQLKANAYIRKGELAITVIQEERRNQICSENLDVKITVVHKYSRHLAEKKVPAGRRTSGNKKKAVFAKPADRNVVEHRANWSEFNTSITEEANERYLNRHGL